MWNYIYNIYNNYNIVLNVVLTCRSYVTTNEKPKMVAGFFAGRVDPHNRSLISNWKFQYSLSFLFYIFWVNCYIFSPIFFHCFNWGIYYSNTLGMRELYAQFLYNMIAWPYQNYSDCFFVFAFLFLRNLAFTGRE